MGKYMMVKCDKCGKENKADRTDIEIRMTAKGDYEELDITQIWCRQCCLDVGLLLPPQKERQKDFVPRDTADLLTELIESLGFTRE